MDIATPVASSERAMKPKQLLWILACILPTSAPAWAQSCDPAPACARGGGAHFSDGHGGWAAHPGWHGNIQHFNSSYWQGGHLWHGTYQNRLGWSWIVGPDWYWYPNAVYPYPNPYTPPDIQEGYWYWCDAYQHYYPYIGACPSGWRAVQPQPS
jgi:hypothetical protein